MPSGNATFARNQMVDTIRKLSEASGDAAARDLDPRVLDVMVHLPRHLFVPAASTDDAYINALLEIGHGQTISQPFVVALMTSLARIGPNDRVLEIGTGSGYQTAVLAALAAHVFSIELVADLAGCAAQALHAQQIANVTLEVGNGTTGLPRHAPYDAIVVTAAPAEVPAALVEQLAPRGRLVIPVDTKNQSLTLLEKSTRGEIRQHPVIAVRFVPLVA